MTKPYYYNYEYIYQKNIKNQDFFVPSFSLIDFYQQEIKSKVRQHFVTDLNILELGCGQGSFFEGISEEHIDVMAIDISPTAIEIAKENQKIKSAKKIKYVCADVCELNLEKKFDLVMDAHVLHCLCRNEERDRYYKNIFNHTASDGFFAFETMLAHKRMDFENGFYFHQEEQTLFKEIFDENFCDLRTFYGQRYMPIRSIKNSHDIERELKNAGFKIIFFQILSGYKVIYNEKRLKAEDGDPDLLRVICRK